MSGAACPGTGTSGPGEPPALVCGVDFGNNSYYSTGRAGGFRANLTVNTGGRKDLPYHDWQTLGNDAGSKVFELPSEELLLFWMRQKLGMPTGPEPAPPAPLPPAPPPHFDDTCVGQCAANQFFCTGNVSGCQRPSCVMGCAFGNFTASNTACAAQCALATGQCSYTIAKGFTVQMCGTCPGGCPACDDAGACEKGCELAFKRRADTNVQSPLLLYA